MTYIASLRPLLYDDASPLVLSDRLLNLARDADQRGERDAALQLLDLAHRVLDYRVCPTLHRAPAWHEPAPHGMPQTGPAASHRTH